MPVEGRCRWKATARGAEKGSDFVEGAERPDAWGVLGYPRATNDTGLAVVTGAGIEPRGNRASGRPGSASRGEPSPWTGQNEMCSTSLCFASARQSRQMNPLRSLHAIPNASMFQLFPGELSLEEPPPPTFCPPSVRALLGRGSRGAA